MTEFNNRPNLFVFYRFVIGRMILFAYLSLLLGHLLSGFLPPLSDIRLRAGASIVSYLPALYCFARTGIKWETMWKMRTSGAGLMLAVAAVYILVLSKALRECFLLPFRDLPNGLTWGMAHTLMPALNLLPTIVVLFFFRKIVNASRFS